jgi:serine/threonine protein kinase
LGNYHPNVLGCQEVLQDDQWLYILIPYCTYGSLYSKIIKKEEPLVHSPRTIMQSGPMDVDTNQRYRHSIDYEYENKIRSWFRQILQALSHFQKKGVCHLDICLENILIVDDRCIAITDFGSSLRIPYDDESNPGVISDVSQGSQRRLLRLQENTGNNHRLSYLAPEIIDGSPNGCNGFDGFAADLWSAGVVLFICLVGSAPFKWAHRTDYHYSLINQGKLHLLVKEANVVISPEACDLLQNMFWSNPSNRLVLSDICSHPWVVGGSTRPVSSTGQHGTIGMQQQQQQLLQRTAISPFNHPPLREIPSSLRRPPLVPSLYPRESTR